MIEHDTTKPSLPGSGGPRRKAVSLSSRELVQQEAAGEGTLPVVMKPAVVGVSLAEWVRNNRDLVLDRLLASGGILFKGFALKDEGEFEELVRALSGELLEYVYRSTPRSQVSGRIYTSTEYPADQAIPLHNEMAYSPEWPMKIWFFCVKSAAEGGETPIADSRKVYARIDPAIRRRFEERGVMYIRNYGEGLDLTWQEVFQADRREQAEEYCREHGIEIQWKADGRVRTRQVCQGVARHPRTGDPVWFNQAHLFHVSSLRPEIRDSLLAAFKEEDLPRNSYYGDGTALETSVLEEIRQVYAEESIVFPWTSGDLLLLDNMLVAHGRRPFAGTRRVVVGMAEPHRAGV